MELMRGVDRDGLNQRGDRAEPGSGGALSVNIA
jgi:hypothetical protein